MTSHQKWHPATLQWPTATGSTWLWPK
jgi:hypothetical protein